MRILCVVSEVNGRKIFEKMFNENFFALSFVDEEFFLKNQEKIEITHDAVISEKPIEISLKIPIFSLTGYSDICISLNEKPMNFIRALMKRYFIEGVQKINNLHTRKKQFTRQENMELTINKDNIRGFSTGLIFLDNQLRNKIVILASEILDFFDHFDISLNFKEKYTEIIIPKTPNLFSFSNFNFIEPREGFNKLIITNYE